MEPGSNGSGDTICDCGSLEKERGNGDGQKRPPEDFLVMVWNQVAYPAKSVLHAAD